jgi:hypothetical protein
MENGEKVGPKFSIGRYIIVRLFLLKQFCLKAGNPAERQATVSFLPIFDTKVCQLPQGGAHGKFVLTLKTAKSTTEAQRHSNCLESQAG